MSKTINAVAVAGAMLAVAAGGYAYFNPAFAASCKSQFQTGLSWAQRQAEAAQARFEGSSFYATYQKAKREHVKRAEQRKKKSAQAPQAARVEKPLDLSPAAVRERERATWSPGQKIAYDPSNARACKQLGFLDTDQMASHIDRVIGYASPSATKPLSGGRTAYWDERTRCVIIVDPKSGSGGSMFKPVEGYPYFKDLKAEPQP